MKRWGWLLAGLIWFLILFAVTFDFEARSFGGFGVRVQPVKLIPKQYTATVAWLLLHFILLGWLIPLSIGIMKVLRKR